MCTAKARNDPIWGILLFLFLINFGFFITIWLIGVSQPGNHNFVHTLSYMLAHSEELRTLYIIWWSVYAVTNMYILYVVLYYSITEVDNGDSEELRKKSFCGLCHECKIEYKRVLFAVGTAIYTPFLLLKLLGLVLLWHFSLDIDQDSHIVFTAIAIVSSLFVSIGLFIRRLTIRTYICIHPSVLWVLIINFLCIAASVSLSITFLVLSTGPIEFALAILIGIDPIFQIIDYTWDLHCEHTQKLHAGLLEEKLRKPEKIKEEDSSTQHLLENTGYNIETTDKRVYNREN